MIKKAWKNKQDRKQKLNSYHYKRSNCLVIKEHKTKEKDKKSRLTKNK